MPKSNAPEPQITKRRITMRNAMAVPASPDHPAGIAEIVATDYVLPEVLDATVAYLQTKWQRVEVSDEPDAGPGGYHGATYFPEWLDHPEAGTTRPATS
jgi:hypothetical protein